MAQYWASSTCCVGSSLTSQIWRTLALFAPSQSLQNCTRNKLLNKQGENVVFSVSLLLYLSFLPSLLLLFSLSSVKLQSYSLYKAIGITNVKQCCHGNSKMEWNQLQLITKTWCIELQYLYDTYEAQQNTTSFHIQNFSKTSSESSIVGLWQVLKQRFTKTTKVLFCCKIVCRYIRNFHNVSSVELQVQFRHLLPQLGVSQLLEDVVGKNANEGCNCYGDRSVPNSKLIDSCELISWTTDIVDHGGSG